MGLGITTGRLGLYTGQGLGMSVAELDDLGRAPVTNMAGDGSLTSADSTNTTSL